MTYAIELRADILYPIYQEVLERNNSKIMVKSIIVEEQGHLEEMTAQLETYLQDWKQHANRLIEIEERLFKEWMQAIRNEMLQHE